MSRMFAFSTVCASMFLLALPKTSQASDTFYVATGGSEPTFDVATSRPAVRPASALGVIRVEEPVRADEPVTIDVSYPRSWCFDEAETTVADGRIDIFAREICGCLGGPGPGVFQAEVGPLAIGDYTIELTRQGFDGGGGTCDDRELVATRAITVATQTGVTAIATDPPKPFAGEDVELLVTLPCFALAEVESAVDRIVWLSTVVPPTTLPCVGQVVTRFDLGPLPAGEHSVVVRDNGGDPRRFEGIGRFGVRDPGSETVILAGRYAVVADWIRPDGIGGRARGRLIEGSDIGAELYFRNPANPELLVKVLDGCELNGHRWFFAGGLTNLGVGMTVTDLVTGEEIIHGSTVGDDFAPILDTRAFACE